MNLFKLIVDNLNNYFVYGAKSRLTRFQVFMSIEQGGRNEQQDSVDVFERNGRLLAIVCDGAGGHRGGREASQTAVDTARFAFEKAGGIFGDPQATLEQICREADIKIRKLGDTPKDSPKSTIAMLYLSSKCAHWVHVGDSRVYRICSGRLKERTRDHSMVQILLEQGEVTEDEMGTHPDQGRLLRALGSGEDLKVSYAKAKTSDCDGFLLCTDGFWERTKLQEIEDFFRLKPAAEKLNSMVSQAVRRNGPKGDNTTALAVIVGSAKRNWMIKILVILFILMIFTLFGVGFFLRSRGAFDFHAILKVVDSFRR